MHPVAHAVEIPLDQLERILLDHAREDFDGSVEIEVRVLPDAVRLIELLPETHEFSPMREPISPIWNSIGKHEPAKLPLDREAIVRRVMHENAGKIRLVSTVRKIIGQFSKGELRKLEWVKPG